MNDTIPTLNASFSSSRIKFSLSLNWGGVLDQPFAGWKIEGAALGDFA